MKKCTDRHHEEILKIAVCICIEAPERPGKYVQKAKVHWRWIERLQREVTAAGFDLKALRQEARDGEGKLLTVGTPTRI
jgi:hypothetical protein